MLGATHVYVCLCVSVLGKTSALIGFVNQGFKRPLALLYFRDGNTTRTIIGITDMVHSFSLSLLLSLFLCPYF